MSNNFYTPSGNPATSSSGSSAVMRSELSLIEAGFDKLPTLTANGFKIVRVNSGGTGLEAVDPLSIFGTTFGLSSIISPSQITANQNDYSPTGLSTATVLRLNSDASRDITGLAGGASGRIILIHNVGSQNIVLKDENGSSSAANRFALFADYTLPPDFFLWLQYDSTSARWRCSGLQGSAVGQSLVQAASVSAARAVISAAASGANADITSLQAGVTLTNPAMTHQILTDAATVNWAMDSGSSAQVTIAGNRYFATPTEMRRGTWVLLVIQDGTGGRDPTFSSNWKWSAGVKPVFSTAANATDILSGYCDGTNMHGGLFSRGSA
jgi:hypothetical protein